MNDHSHDYQPPTLLEVLDRGEDLATYVSMSSFVEVLAEIEVTAPKALRERLSHRLTPQPPRSGGAEANEERTSHLWALEIVDHPELMPRVVATLPPDVANEVRERVYEEQHEHPLEVGFPVDTDNEATHWNCCNCGAKYDAGEAEALIIHPGHGGFDYQLFYCRSCVALAAALLEVETSH